MMMPLDCVLFLCVRQLNAMFESLHGVLFSEVCKKRKH